MSFQHDLNHNSSKSTRSTISREWFLWKQTTLLCSLTFASVLGTITQIKQMMNIGTNHKNYSLLLCVMLSSLLLQCFVAIFLLILTHKSPDWLKDINHGTALIQRTINIIMAAVFVVSLMEICEFVLMN
jgi:threonine/homoserine/homoserine lactone efflux protein